MRLILGLIFLLTAMTANAAVVGEIIGYTQDDNGNIIVQTAYYIDGQNVPSRYPQKDGKYYWVSRYSFQNFDGMDAKGIEARIQKDVDDFAKALIVRRFTASENAKIDLSPLIGKTFTSTTADVQISQTKAFVVSTTEKLSEKDIVK